jgi:general secretion pathway protein G
MKKTVAIEKLETAGENAEGKLCLTASHSPLAASHCSSRHSPLATRHCSSGFTLLELLAAMVIMLLLTSVALPLARVQIQRSRETELRRALRQVREAIDRYKDFADRGIIPTTPDSFGYPPDLDTLVSGVVLKGASTAKYKFLRRIPIDPMTGKADWGLRAMQDDPDSHSWGGSNVFDIFSQSSALAMDGTKYGDW